MGGSPFADTLTGDPGDNQLSGGDGADVLTGGGGADTLDGGSGLDVISYASSAAAVTVDLASRTASGGHATGDVFSSIEGAVGSAFADTVTGDADDNVLMGMGGADVLDGGAGRDLLYHLYSPSGVTVSLNTGTASGGHATGDVISGFEGILGSAYDDVLTGSSGPDELQGLGGDDTLVGLADDDILLAGDGVDAFHGGAGTDTCDVEAGEVASQCEQ